MALRIIWLGNPGDDLAAIVRRPDGATMDPASGLVATLAQGAAPPSVGLKPDPAIANLFEATIPDAVTKGWPDGVYPVAVVEAKAPAFAVGITSASLYRGSDQPPDWGAESARTLAKALLAAAQTPAVGT